MKQAFGVLAALAALVAAGCGGGSGDSGAGGGTPSGLIDVELQDFAFEANSWTVQAGSVFEVHLENTGFNQHSWAIIRQGHEISDESEFDEGDVLFRTEILERTKTEVHEITVEEAGTYQVICTIRGHFSAGMEGTLTVVS